MKYLFLFIVIIFSLFLAGGCSDDPFGFPRQDIALQNFLTLDFTSPSKGDITWEELQVILVRIFFTDPAGWVQTAQLVPGDAGIIQFQTRVTGVHTLEVFEYSTNSNGVTNLATNGASVNVIGGYNYYVHITIGGNIIIIIDTYTNTTNTNGGTNTNTNVAAPLSFGLYSDSVPITVLWDTDTRLDIWNDPENNISNTLTVLDQSNSTGEGRWAWKLNGLSPTIYWIGMGIRVEPLTNCRDLRFFTNGSLDFLFRGTRGFKVGLKDGNGVQQWIKPIQMTVYGLNTNDAWNRITIPLRKFDKIDFSKIEQYFMWSADTTMGYTTNRAYYLDHIYFTNVYSGPFDNYVETNFGIYSESVEQSVNMNYDTELSIWTNGGGGMVLSDDAADVGEGTRAWKLTGTGTWMGFGIFAWPGNAWKDMSAYANGALHFMYKGAKTVAKIGSQSRKGDGSLYDAAVPGFDLANYFGLKTNNTWGEVVIPVSYLRWKGLDVSRVNQYFYLAQDINAGYVPGDIFRIDNIYWTKTPGGNMSWTTNSNTLAGFGIYSETVPLGVKWDVDTIMEVWHGAAVLELTGDSPEGFHYWKITATDGPGGWMGLGIRVKGDDDISDMSAYANGHVNFLFKGTAMFDGIGFGWEWCGNPKVFFSPSELAAYGLKRDGAWCQVSIPVSAIAAKGLKIFEWKFYFIFQSSGQNYVSGANYYFDNIYYSKN